MLVREHPYIRDAIRQGLGEFSGEIFSNNVPDTLQGKFGRILE